MTKKKLLKGLKKEKSKMITGGQYHWSDYLALKKKIKKVEKGD